MLAKARKLADARKLANPRELAEARVTVAASGSAMRTFTDAVMGFATA
jgi:hypothetical protein